MKKMILLPCFLLALRLFGQLGAGFVAPNFSAADVNGHVWNLYEILDQGKTVILDFSTTWCEPCWDYHEAHHLKSLYQEFGPDGTDELMIFLVECDRFTTLNELQGMGPRTLGNWIEGTPYPIIDSYRLSETFGITGYPTFFVICPNKLAHKVTSLPALPAGELFAAAVQGCPPATLPDNGAILDWSGTANQACAGEALVPEIVFSNFGTNPITVAEISMRLNGNHLETLNWTGNLATHQLTKIAFTPFVFGDDPGAKLDFEIASINGQEDSELKSNTLSHQVNSAAQIHADELTVKLYMKGVPKETYWEIRKSGTLEVIASGGNELVGPDGGGLYEFTEEVPVGEHTYIHYSGYTIPVPVPGDGCYEFHVIDALGNGLFDEQGAYVKLLNKGEVLFSIGPDDWGREFIKVVKISTTRRPIFASLNDLKTFPNPVADELQVDFVLEKAELLAISISNALGETVFSSKAQAFPIGKNRFPVAVSNLPGGIYFLRIGSEEGQVARKIVVNKP